MKRSCFILVLALGFAGCSKDGGNNRVEIYALKSFQYVTGRCQVNAATAVLETQPLVSNNDIRGYVPGAYEFTISDDAAHRIRGLKDNAGFALTVNGEVVYYGIYKPGYSSSLCFHSITMTTPFTNKFNMQISYSFPQMGAAVVDDRNAAGLLLVLRKQHKLY